MCMDYVNLDKLYYKDRSTYSAEYEKRFSADTTIRPDFDIQGNPAFICQADEVYSLIYDILAQDKAIFALRMQLPAKAAEQYSRRCLVDEIVLTNNIEGVHSSRKEIGDALDILEEQSENKGRKTVFTGIVKKYRALISGEAVSLSTCRDIRTIYDQIVLDEVAGSDQGNIPDGEIFRKGLSELYSPTGKIIHRGKYPESEIIRYMDKALAFLNDSTVNVLIRICVFHYLFEYIHPFYDGNGRTGRFILSYCISENLENLLAFRISAVIRENLSAYYRAFTVCNEPRNLGDLTPFLIMMLKMIRTASLDLKNTLDENLRRWKNYLSLYDALNLPDHDSCKELYDYLVQASLFSEMGVSTGELLALLNITHNTLKKRLASFEAAGLLKTGRNGNKKYYSLDLSLLDRYF